MYAAAVVQVQKLAAKEFEGENIPPRILMIFPNEQQNTARTFRDTKKLEKSIKYLDISMGNII